jgi:fermentation-respiration switch protein FrsA (DUF1100 family)
VKGGDSLTRSIRVLRGIFVALAAAYLFIVGAVWYAQAKFIFHPSESVDGTPADLGIQFESVTLSLGTGQLAGWWVPSDTPISETLLYLHGNAANVSANVRQVARLRKTGLNIFIFDYRGYGHSTGGPPREKRLYEDAERAWKYLVSERNIAPASIAIYGHSLGGAVAVNLARNHPEAGALITDCTLTSIAERAAGMSFTALLPVRLILTERFDSISKIGSVRIPKLILQGEADRMALPMMAHRLYDAAPEPKQIALIPGGGHEDSAEVNPTAYFSALNGFLRKFGFKAEEASSEGR